jgi:hypothetical protein
MKNLLVLLTAISTQALGATLESSTAKVFPGVYLTTQNYAPNPSCASTAVGYTATGGTATIAADTTAAKAIDGAKSCLFTPSGAGDYVQMTSGLTARVDHRGKNCEARVSVMGDASGYTIGLYDSGTLINSVTGVSSTSAYQDYSIPYPCGSSSSSFKLRLTSTTGTNAVNFGNVYFGPITNITSVNQAKVAAQWYFTTTASCTWPRTGTSLAAFTSTAACPGPTVQTDGGVGSPQTTDADLPQVTLNNAPPGVYKVTFTGGVQNTSTSNNAFTISDGTGTAGNSNYVSTNTGNTMAVVGFFTYTTTANRTWSLWASASSGTINLNNATGSAQTNVLVEFVPSQTQYAYKPDSVARSWSGNHGSDCLWTTTSATPADPTADASCTFTETSNDNFGTVSTYGSKLPGVTFTAKSAGYYEVCTTTAVYTGTVNIYISLWLKDESGNILSNAVYRTPASNVIQAQTMCGHFQATAGASKTIKIHMANSDGVTTANLGSSQSVNTVNWTIKNLSAGTPAPLVIGSITSNTSGMERIERARFTTSAGPACAVSTQSGSWITGTPSSSGTGQCGFVIASGMFASTPDCTVSLQTSASGISVSGGATSATAGSFQIWDAAGAGAAGTAIVRCQGPR